MNHIRQVSVGDQSTEEVAPSSKRQRLVRERAPTIHSSIKYLNNLGVDCLKHGDIINAKKYFHNAMNTLAPSLPQNPMSYPHDDKVAIASLPVETSTNTSCEQIVQDTTHVISSMSIDDDDQDDTQGQYCNNNKKKFPPPLSPLTPGHVSPPRVISSGVRIGSNNKSEYDEGMNSYNRPLHIDSSNFHTADCQRTMAPVILFNIGQLYVLEGNDRLATNYFMYALDSVNHNSGRQYGILPSNSEHIIKVIPILHNLGHIYYRAKDYNLAMNMYSQALDIAKQSPREKKNLQASASSLNCLGVILFHTSPGNSKSIEMLNTSFSIRESILSTCPSGCNEKSALQQEIATTMNNIGRVHYRLGEHTKALKIYIKAYELRRDLLSKDHLDLAASAYNLAQTHHQLGNLDEAMTLYREFYNVICSQLGPSTRDVAIILKCMAQVYHDKSQYDEAAKLYNKSLDTTKNTLGELHAEVASLLNKIGNMNYENSDFEAAIKVYEEGLAVERAVLKSDHHNIVVTLTNIAQSHKHLGNYAAALEKYTDAYNLQRTLLGSTHSAVATTLSNVAQVSCRLGHMTQSLKYYKEVLTIRRAAHGDEHQDVAATLNSIGLVLFKQGRHSLAIEMFEESLSVRRLCLGDHHRDVAVVLYNVATTHLERGDEDKAMKYYAETIDIERSALGKDHPGLVVTLQHIGQVFRRRGELGVALEYLTEVLRIERLHQGNRSLKVARILNKMGNIYLQKADIPNMMKCFAEATRIFDSLNHGHEQDTSTPRSDIGIDVDENANTELNIIGYNFYSLSIKHPESAAAA